MKKEDVILLLVSFFHWLCNKLQYKRRDFYSIFFYHHVGFITSQGGKNKIHLQGEKQRGKICWQQRVNQSPGVKWNCGSDD